MNRDDIIRMAREAGFVNVRGGLKDNGELSDYWDCWPGQLERFANLVAAAEREAWPRLDPVIAWLENGCDPAEAAKELRIYAAAIRARGEK